jgi:hypothetical protein
MGKVVFAVVVLVIIGATLVSRHSDEQYILEKNFSVWMPETPVKTVKTNDEGLPATNWSVKHTGVTTAESYGVDHSCYREELNPDDELTPNDQMLLLNGIRRVDSHRAFLTAKETKRQVPVLYSTTKEMATDIVLSSVHVVDGHCILSVSARVNPDNKGMVGRVLDSVTVFR